MRPISASIDFNRSDIQNFNLNMGRIRRQIQQNGNAVALRQASRPVVRAARRLAPRRTGFLSRSIIAVTRRQPRRNLVTTYIGANREAQMPDGLFERGRRRGTARFIRPVRYLHLAAFGNRRRRISRANSFIVRAFQDSSDEAIRIYRNVIGGEIEKAVGTVVTRRLRNSARGRR